MQYQRRRLPAVEAFQYDGTGPEALRISDVLQREGVGAVLVPFRGAYIVNALNHHLHKGDWVVRRPAGGLEFYKAGAFEELFELVPEIAAAQNP